MQKSFALIQYDNTTGFEFLFAKPYRSGAYASGTHKLAQDFVAELLTQRGSVRFDPNYGSRFTTEFRGSNMLSINELHGMLSRGIHDVVLNMRNREKPTDDPAEMLATAVIMDLQQHLDRVIVALKITSEAGEPLVLRLPLDLTETTAHA